MTKIKRDPKRTEAIRKFLELYQPESVDDIYESLKDMLGETIEQMLEAELVEQIGYSKGSKLEGIINARNGYSSKTLKSNTGELDINIPRDRNGEFEPQIIKKY
jgi:transposase-like protein